MNIYAKYIIFPENKNKEINPREQISLQWNEFD